MIIFSNIKNITIPEGNVINISASNVNLWSSNRTSDEEQLPNEYTKIEYIRFDGNSWIDTIINPSHYPDGIEYHFKGRYIAQNATNDYLFGCLASGRRSGNVAINRQAGGINLYLSDSSAALKRAPLPEFDTDFEIYLKATPEDAANAVMKFNGETISNGYIPSNSTMPDGNIYLGYCSGVGSTSKPFIGNVYSFNMARANGSLIRNYIPVKHQNGTVGMYDYITGTFFTNSGTGTFTAGPEII